MFKHSPSRNQRSKGFKIKHALQIALLLAVCIWLIYQVKHSHDKKKAFEENAAKLSEKIESQHDIIKFGRKDLNPRVEKTASENERHGEEEETQEEEEEEIKHEEEEEEIKHDEEEEQEEEENKPEEIENEGRGDGDDEIDEHEQHRTEEEAKREEDFVDEEERDKHDNENEENEMEETQSNEREEETKESEEKVNEEENKESAEKVNEEENKENEEETKESEEKENEKETKERENQVEEQDHDMNTQEAREEQYKGDDASSAVVRDTQAVSTEGKSGVIGNLNEKEHVENLQANELGMENKTSNLDEVTSEQKDSDLKAGDGETTEGNSTVTATDGNSAVNATEIQEKGTEINLSKLEDGSLPILTTKESIDLQEVNNISTAENVGTPSASLLNGSDITQNQTVETTSSNEGGDLDHKPVLLDQTENSNMAAEMLRSDSNSSLSTTTQNEDASKKESEESSSNSGTVVQEEQNAREEGSSKSSTTNENGDEDQNENSETTTEEEDNSSSSTTNDNVDLIDNNSTEDSLFHELKEAQTDLGTLPEIETEGNNSEDVAAER